jgi:hypothetical protein
VPDLLKSSELRVERMEERLLANDDSPLSIYLLRVG